MSGPRGMGVKEMCARERGSGALKRFHWQQQFANAVGGAPFFLMNIGK
jgi:hypothetical protein